MLNKSNSNKKFNETNNHNHTSLDWTNSIWTRHIQKIDTFLTSFYNNGNLNENVLVAEKGKVIYKKSFGFSNDSTKEILNENSIFELASVSKQFTAMAICNT
ncbi:MAG TPA: serine hydrolase domain-containing protein [Saprospiraceae bacterium]|nr:serine hydrolase domain-containing protein [Saprospiraceae bacterium]